MAKAFGKPIQVDNTTIAMEFGFFASVLVEVDFSKKIPDWVWVGEGDDDIENGFWQDAVIPKLPKKEFPLQNCGTFGFWVQRKAKRSG